jgi:hypothetical protein
MSLPESQSDDEEGWILAMFAVDTGTRSEHIYSDTSKGLPGSIL